MKDIFLRTKKLAMYVIKTGSTIRQTSKIFGIAKSTIHYDLSKRLPYIDSLLYKKVREILDKNFNEKNIRGGLATQKKYAILKAENSEISY